MELEGQIEEFIYQNDTNNYSIAIFMTNDNELMTVVGYLPFISVRWLLKIIWENGNASRIWRTI